MSTTIPKTIRIFNDIEIGFGVIDSIASLDCELDYKLEYKFPTYWVVPTNKDCVDINSRFATFRKYVEQHPDKFELLLQVPNLYHNRLLHFYRKSPSSEGIEPTNLIRVGRGSLCACCGIHHTSYWGPLAGHSSPIFIVPIPESKVIKDFIYNNSKSVMERDGILIAHECALTQKSLILEARSLLNINATWNKTASEISKLTGDIVEVIWRGQCNLG